MRLTPPTLVALALALTLPASPAEPNAPFGQNPQPSNAPTIQVYSRETILDVLVTDDKGQPVRGLTRSDFTILEDNKPQPIRGFSEFDKATPPPPPRTPPPNTYTNSAALPANGPVQILLIDEADSGPAYIERSRQYIADYLRTMPPGTQVAIFHLSPTKSLRLLQGFTTDGKLAAAALNNFNVEWDVIWDQRISFDAKIAALNQLAAYVASIHGRKNLIWVVPHVLLVARDGGYADPCGGVPDMTYAHRLMDLYDIFTREQISVYKLSPKGVPRMGCSDLRDEEVTEQTGGVISDSNDWKGAIAGIVDDTSHGYTLSFVPPRPAEDSHYHPISIKVDRPGLHLTYRDGYNDEQPDPPSAVLKQQMTQGPMRLGALPATQVLFDLHVQPASPDAQPTKTPVSNPAPAHTKDAPYHALFTFDPTQIALTQNPDGIRTASIELDLGAYDFYGKLVAARSQTFKITVTPAQDNGFYRKPLNLSLAIDLPRGQLTLRAGVFDTSDGKIGTLEIPLTIPKK